MRILVMSSIIIQFKQHQYLAINIYNILIRWLVKLQQEFRDFIYVIIYL